MAGMNKFYDELSDRFMIMAVNVINLEKRLCKTYAGRHIYNQLFRAVTSVGANYEEARAGESRADFVHKMQIVLKELRETQFWLKRIKTAKLTLPDDENLTDLLRETNELTGITAKSVVTAKSINPTDITK